MAKLRKQRRKKVFRHSVNRKRLRNKITSTGTISCTQIKNAWEAKHSVRKNMSEMGLCYDPNSSLKRDQWQTQRNANTVEAMDVSQVSSKSSKSHVSDALKEDAHAARRKLFRLPNSEVEFLTYMLSSYGLDYAAMTKDKKNYNQHTAHQMRQKVKRFQASTEQYQQFLSNADDQVLFKLQETA